MKSITISVFEKNAQPHKNGVVTNWSEVKFGNHNAMEFDSQEDAIEHAKEIKAQYDDWKVSVVIDDFENEPNVIAIDENCKR